MNIRSACVQRLPKRQSVGIVPLCFVAPEFKLNGSHYGRRLATVIPGDSAFEAVAIGGTLNFLALYGNLLVGRILLSFFPQAMSSPIVQPILQICDPYLNLFRGILPSLGGLDFSPILAFTALQALTTATATLGAEIRSKATPRKK